MKIKKKKTVVALAVVAVLVLAIGTMVVMASNQMTTLVASTVIVGDVQATLSVTGTIVSGDSITYFSPGSVKVTAVNFKVGEIVQPGDTIVEFDGVSLNETLQAQQLAIRSAELGLQSAQNTLDRNQENINDLKEEIEELRRKIELRNHNYEYGERVASWEASLETKKTQLEGYESARDGYLIAYEQAEITLQQAQLTNQGTSRMVQEGRSGIVADFEGVITALSFTEGGTNAAGTVVVQSTSDIKVDFSVGKYDANQIELGQQVTVTFGNHVLQGSVTHIDGAAITNASGTTLGAQVSVSDPTHVLKIGLETDLDILTAESNNALVVPVESVKQDRDGHYVYLLVPADPEQGICTVVKTYVQVGISSDTYYEIVSGLSQGDHVAALPPSNIETLSTVRILVSQ